MCYHIGFTVFCSVGLKNSRHFPALSIRFKPINCDLLLKFSCALGSVLFSKLSSDWLLVISSLVVVLRHSIEMCPESEMMGNGWLSRIGSMSLVYDLKIVQLSGLTNRTKIDDLTCSHHLQKTVILLSTFFCPLKLKFKAPFGFSVSNYKNGPLFLVLCSIQVYQIYARRPPEEVYKILRQHGTDYIILENSICLSQQDRGCRLVDLLDLDNGHMIEGGQSEEGLHLTNVPRFCKAIKTDVKNFSPYFKKVFENRTFYLYKLL